MKHRSQKFRRHGKGFTLIEALVALLALSIGLLGVAGLQLSGLRNNLSAGWRSQATYLSYDIIDRIRANLKNRTDYNIALGAAAGGGTLAKDDLTAWRTNLANALPGGQGGVVVDGTNNNNVTVTIQWNDERGTPPVTMQFLTETRL